jgi:hypothetical protein
VTLQLILVGVVALAASTWLARQAWKTWADGCSGGCCKNADPKTAPKPLIKPEELLTRLRQRPSGG